jgi:hypothetical protein
VFCHIVKINYVAIRKPVCSRQTVDRSPSPQPLPIDHQPLTARPIYAHLSPAEIVFFSFTPMTLVIPTPSALGLAYCVGYHSLSLFVPVTVSFPKSNYFLWKYYTGAYTHTIRIYIYMYIIIKTPNTFSGLPCCARRPGRPSRRHLAIL